MSPRSQFPTDSFTPLRPPQEPLPASRGELLEKVGSPGRRIFFTVRGLLDLVEEAAPWDALYYPPAKPEDVGRMLERMVDVIDQIPVRVRALVTELEKEGVDEDLVGDLEFFFQGIHMSVLPELEQLRHKLAGLREHPDEHSDQKGEFLCELAADVKGKVSSSMMGASSSLISGARWNGVEIEPVLFPEKAEEFDRNRKLVETLSEVTEAITNLLHQIPLASLVERWRNAQRIDQYALTPLYSFLGNLGRLMQESSRRALYSGDYHQIRRRENRLSSRIAEITTLHNMTWGIVQPGMTADMATIYPLLAKKATELAAVLDFDILRKILGKKQLDDLLMVVTMEKDSGKQGRRERLPEELQGLVPLLYDEDLKTFLELLLGSVLKRASLAVKKESAPAPAPVAVAPAAPAAPMPVVHAAPPAAPAASSSLFPDVDEVLGLTPAAPAPAAYAPRRSVAFDAELDALSGPSFGEAPVAQAPAPVAPKPAAGVISRESKLRALEDLVQLLEDLGSRANPDRKSFELILRLLKQQRVVPPSMLQSMHPYLYGLMNELIPRLNEIQHLGSQLSSHSANLIQLCQTLCQPNPSQEQLHGLFPSSMQRLLNLIDGLSSAALASIEKLRMAP